ncbi:hypothetical protein NUW54_g6112 [Trametes sanguinea]|uniref:Uncharacterized protein n=1 Tax=Trametes sanguinea TaxID=158606 RepID=A0ACC1PW62_9APHY|nr:hypothetical protein NUW54_g6112 [Trametes sanguinea]
MRRQAARPGWNALQTERSASDNQPNPGSSQDEIDSGDLQAVQMPFETREATPPQSHQARPSDDGVLPNSDVELDGARHPEDFERETLDGSLQNGAQDEGEMDVPDVTVTLGDMKTALEFIRLLQHASLDNAGLPAELIERIRKPSSVPFSIDNPDVLLSIKLYIATANASDDTYNEIRDVKKTIEELTGVVGQRDDMCVNSCIGYTGPYASLDRCPKCGQDRYCPIKLRAGKKVARQTFTSMLPSTQIQAFFASKDVAPDMGWFFDTARRIIASTPPGSASLKEFQDVVSSSELLRRVADGSIKEHDAVLMFSIDGAQLYQNKASDCWMSLWLLCNIPPDKRYKKPYMIPGVIIPGPNHPQDLDSFLFPSFHHVAAVMHEGLPVYHATLRQLVVSNLFFAFGMADGPGMAMFEGTVGHHGAFGCRVLCGLLGRHKAGGPHYYPAMLKPLGVPVPGCDHDDVLLASLRGPSVEEYNRNLQVLLSARNDTQYKQLRKATGLCKPSIVSGLPRALPIPFCFPPDLMHLAWLNIPDLYLSLWRGTIKGSTQSDAKSWDCAVLATEEMWSTHGRLVERAMPYLPGFFDRPPRNIAEKVNSGYKATEYKTWFYNYAPAMLRHSLPYAYWGQLCELVRGITLLFAETILPEDLIESKQQLSAAVLHHEQLYYARDPDRLHVVRPCVHSVWHAPDMVVSLGSLICVTQLPMERLIGDLGSQIRQPSNPFANLSQRALRRCQENAIKALDSRINHAQDGPHQVPRGAVNLGHGFVLLRARDRSPRRVSPEEGCVFYDFLAVREPGFCANKDRAAFTIKVHKWARLRLPNDTVVRSAWKEREKPLKKLRMARCVKFMDSHDRLNVAEVLYFCEVGEARNIVALVSIFGPRDPELFEASKKTVQLHTYQGTSSLRVIDVKSIRSVVGVIPDDGAVGRDYETDYQHLHEGSQYFVVEKLGFEVTMLESADPEINVDE